MSTQSLAKKETELHQEIEWENRKVRIIRWEYSEEQHLMEVELDITNTKYDGIDTYHYSAMETNAGFLKVKPVIEESDWVIIQIHNIPEKWAEVSFRMELPDEAGEASEKLKLYTNINKVAKVDSLEILDRKGYLVKRYDGEIVSKHHISEQEDRIVVEKDNMTKFFIRTGGSLVRIAANICIGALAIIGLAALVYPAPRAELLVVWKTILEELLSFM